MTKHELEQMIRGMVQESLQKVTQESKSTATEKVKEQFLKDQKSNKYADLLDFINALFANALNSDVKKYTEIFSEFKIDIWFDEDSESYETDAESLLKNLDADELFDFAEKIGY